ncbi:unnamed protein product [Linum tenue]|uniref:Uncharacterized protein n=1 Tax=Linum tenue TaxID=586396 RepID=A0AAV0H7J1_9ROSI|nr:unnamed protein product [Linum tenue]
MAVGRGIDDSNGIDSESDSIEARMVRGWIFFLESPSRGWTEIEQRRGKKYSACYVQEPEWRLILGRKSCKRREVVEPGYGFTVQDGVKANQVSTEAINEGPNCNYH